MNKSDENIHYNDISFLLIKPKRVLYPERYWLIREGNVF